MTAVTAVTVQNTMGVSGYEALSPTIVGDQIRAVASDIGVDAAKTGMLATTAIVEAVADAVAELAVPNLVVDPVFMSKHGHALLAPDAVDALRVRLVPLAAIVTPNLPEASGLAGFHVETREDMRRAATAMLANGARAVLVKGGHLEDLAGEAADLFVDATGEQWFSAPRIDTPHTHGTGCTLSSAIAAHLALGDPLREAVAAGKEFVTEAIRHALPLGRGIGPVDPMWAVPPAGDA
jgi:hydroxymethylpyrimidine/phosphomethylpyrimidine kinase